MEISPFTGRPMIPVDAPRAAGQTGHYTSEGDRENAEIHALNEGHGIDAPASRARFARKPGRLCFADFAGGVEWSVRQVDAAYVLYRGTEVDSRYTTVDAAHAAFRAHCPDRGWDQESGRAN